MNYADRSRAARAPVLLPPRNIRAAEVARENQLPLVISFIGDTPWTNPTVYCDPGKRYDWSFVSSLNEHTIIAVKTGAVLLDALRSILLRTDTLEIGYPVLLDVDLQEVACVVPGPPMSLWQVRRGATLWQHYFAPQP